MRTELKALKKNLDDKERAQKAEVANLVVNTAKEIIETKKGTPVLVETLNAFNNTKALDMALKKVKSISPETSALFISVDKDEKKIYALSAVPKVMRLSNYSLIRENFTATKEMFIIIFFSLQLKKV